MKNHQLFLTTLPVIGIGTGLGTESKTQIALYDFLKYNLNPIVIASNIINYLGKAFLRLEEHQK